MACEGTCAKRVSANLCGRQTSSQGRHRLAANAQPKTVFSCAMTVMDKICGWGEEEKLAGSLFAACVWVQTKCVLCDGHGNHAAFLEEKGECHLRRVSVGSVRKFRRNTSGYPLAHRCPLKEGEVVEGIGLRTRCSLCGTMGISLVCCSINIKCVTGLSRRQNRQVPRGYKLGNCVGYQCSLRSDM